MTDESAWARDKSSFVDDARRADDEHRRPLPDHGCRLGPLALEFAQLTYALLDATTVGEVLEQIVDIAPRLLPRAEIVAVSLRDPDGRFITPVANDELAVRLDQLQEQFGEGPCFDAARNPGPTIGISSKLATDPNWPRFGPAAAELGVQSALAVALAPDAQPPELSGALNLFCRHPDAFSESDLHVALLLATHASLALAHTHAVQLAELKETNLHRALDSRDVIGQAKGILMARQGVSAVDAFDILRVTSQELNVKLVNIAETLVSRHQELDGRSELNG